MNYLKGYVAVSKKKKSPAKGRAGRPKGSKNKAGKDRRVQGLLKQLGAERPELPPKSEPEDQPLFGPDGKPLPPMDEDEGPADQPVWVNAKL